MCISILCDQYVTAELIGEYVFLNFDQGIIKVREVYDVFFTPWADWTDIRFICISPHVLIKDNRLCVSVVAAPGAGGIDDNVYDNPIGFGRKFSVGDPAFSVRICDVRNPANPQIIEVAGKVITPEIRIPSQISNDDSAIEVMSHCGTVFELCLPPLKANTTYSMRLVVEPVELLGLSHPRNLEEFDLKSVKINWKQDASITCPKNCLFDYKKLLEQVKKFPEVATAAGAIEAIVSNRELMIIRVKRSRIVLVLPPGCDLYREKTIGCILPVVSATTQDSRFFSEYYGGTEKYFADDIESLGTGIWEYLQQWAKNDPKTKEFITTALGAQHNNCSLLVDCMAKKNLIELVDPQRGLYKARDVSSQVLAIALKDIATDPEISAKFIWAGYRIQFAIQYVYLSKSDRLKFLWIKIKFRLAFWLAVLGIVLSVIALSPDRWLTFWEAMKNWILRLFAS